jgi:hypothetical protein
VGDLGCYCPGCYLQLRGAAQVCHIQIHYALEEIVCAFGDDVPAPFEEWGANRPHVSCKR